VHLPASRVVPPSFVFSYIIVSGLTEGDVPLNLVSSAVATAPAMAPSLSLSLLLIVVVIVAGKSATETTAGCWLRLPFSPSLFEPFSTTSDQPKWMLPSSTPVYVCREEIGG